MRLSRPRVLLRTALLLIAAGFMAWRGLDTRATADLPGLDSAGAATLRRIAWVEWTLAALALLTAAVALLSLRQKPRRHSLHLREPDGPAGPDGEPPPERPASDR